MPSPVPLCTTARLLFCCDWDPDITSTRPSTRKTARVMSDCPYNVIEVLGGECGRAAVASRTLQAGEIVLSERALVCVSVAGRLLCDDCLEPIRCCYA